MGFVHLHTHTEYSLLDGSNKIREYVERVRELGMKAAAITDHGVMYGVIDFYKACREAGINPVIGCEIYVSPGSRFDKEPGMSEDRYHHLVLLAENETGYSNLLKIVSIGFTEGYYYRPRVDVEILEKYHEGLICLSACLAGEIPRYIMRGQNEEAEKAALRYQRIFGEGNFYLELQDHGLKEQQFTDQTLIAMSKKLGIPLVCTNDCHYTRKEDAEPHDILLCLQTGKKLSDTDRLRYEGGQYYVKSEEEMRMLFSYIPEALENTEKIAERCHVEIEFHKTKLPRYEIPEGFGDSLSYLKYLCDEGFKERYPNDDGTLRKRMEYELSVIETMGFVDYFLIVWDYINFSKSHGIPVGPGRGSAAGSIVSYCLKITDIDPIRYDLLFERFLNPERVSMPDIDVDFGFEDRQEVIDYVVEKYGRTKCVQIVTFGTLAAKGVLRDVTRVMDLPYAFGDNLSKMIPNELNITIKKAMEENNDLRKAYETDPQIRRVMDMSMRLEGLPRHTSIHAAGILITPEDADRYVPLSRGSNGEITTQFTMTTLEELGLLKMDFLGLRTLTVIKNAVDFINRGRENSETTGDPAEVLQGGKRLDINLIDYDDRETLKFIGTGETDGVFQLESQGMQRFMKDLSPESLEDIIAGIALYRPGPMDFIPQYIEGKRNRQNVHYLCPELEPILKPTYGCIVYQEQVMQIFRQLAGYSLGGADSIRRAMSKKKQKIIDQNRDIFVYGGEIEVRGKDQQIPGCVGNGIGKDAAVKIYASMNDFAKYAFNKSHAACYAFVTMQTAFLKRYFPVEFMASLMTSVLDNPQKLSGYMLSAREMGIKLLPPDINKALSGFSPDGEGSVRYGLSAIKAVGVPVISAIINERENGGEFRSLTDFLNRMAGTEVNKRNVEAFIKAGVFDGLGGNRRQYMEVYPGIMDNALRIKKDSISGQISLFEFANEENGMDTFGDDLPDVEEYPEDVKLAFEKEALGIYLTGHPLSQYMDFLKENTDADSTGFMLNPETGTIGLREGRKVTIGGLITSVRVRQTKKGDTMAVLTLEDLTGTVEGIVWPRVYAEYSGLLYEDAKVLLTGRVKADDEKEGQIMIDEVISFENQGGTLYIQFEDMDGYRENKEKVDRIIKTSRGKDRVVIYLKKEKKRKNLPFSENTDADAERISLLMGLVGEENVRYVEKKQSF